MELAETVSVISLKDAKFNEVRLGVRGVTLFDENTPTKNLFSGIFILEPGGKLDPHYHDLEEMQHVIQGHGIVCDSENKEHHVSPGTTFYCPPGSKGSHGIRNIGDIPFICLYVYSSPGGKRVSSTPLKNQ